MASEKRPVKGILKSSTSFDKGGEYADHKSQEKREMKWDEMNILATYHPEGKEYGHMKIDEPSTPYSKMIDDDISDDDKEEGLDAEALASRLEKNSPRDRRHSFQDDSSEDEPETEEEKSKRKQFELKRKLHYNEFHAVKLGKQLLEQENDEDDDEEAPSADTTSMDGASPGESSNTDTKSAAVQ